MNTQMVKQWLRALAATTVGVLAVASFCNSGPATEPPQAGAPHGDFAKFEEILRRAGASAAEIASFDESLRWQSPTELAKSEQMLQRASPAELTKIVEEMRLVASEQAQHPTLKIGAPLPDFALKPERLLAETLEREGRPVRTRPLFPYPAVAKWTGRGDTNQAANFASVADPEPNRE